MEQDLRNEARSAVIGAAERLGVDPFRLARFLSDGTARGHPHRDARRGGTGVVGNPGSR